VSTATFRFFDELQAFLPRERRNQAFQYSCARAATLKNAIEALGVPHTEVGALNVNGEPATLQRTVRDGDVVEVHSKKSGSDPDLLFLADAHLGGLARFLRMLGYDTLYDQGLADSEIRRLAHEERRIVLTRDRALLKCRDIARGCYVHALKPEAQLREVAARYGLAERAKPFTLCLHCNLPLETVDKAQVAPRLPEQVSELHERFTRCRGCERIYWPGSHYERMLAALRPFFESSR
jgi:uncharacterized protein